MITRQALQKGFTLVETLVAVLILAITITGVFAALSINRDIAGQTRRNFIASGLVQEGVEVVHNLRDNDWLQDRAFGTFGDTSAFAVADGDYRVQSDSVKLLPLDTNPTLTIDSVSGLYSYDSTATSKTTPFHRVIHVQSVPSQIPAVEKIITVTVTWQEKGREMSIAAEEHLFDWL